jgi:hypothetical protein
VSPVKAGADTRQVRIVLPKVSADGMYEIAVFVGGAEEAAILHNSAYATAHADTLELSVSLDFARLRPGSYLLAIRHGDSNWEYVPLVRE